MLIFGKQPGIQQSLTVYNIFNSQTYKQTHKLSGCCQELT